MTEDRTSEGEEYEQQCERCNDYFEAAEETSLCPGCETSHLGPKVTEG